MVDHLELQSARLDTFDNFKTEILRLLEITDPDGSGHDGRPDQRKGKGQGKVCKERNSTENAESAASTYTRQTVGSGKHTVGHRTSGSGLSNSKGKAKIECKDKKSKHRTRASIARTCATGVTGSRGWRVVVAAWSWRLTSTSLIVRVRIRNDSRPMHLIHDS